MSEESKRNESFRYSFTPELQCLIQLYEINSQPLASKQAMANLLDLSPEGCKLMCDLDFKVSYNESKIIIALELLQNMELRGTLIWQEQVSRTFLYGVKIDETHKEEITEQLKAYTKWIRTASKRA
jgi:hypothetical protein